jgi:hypothetical protein
MLGVIDRFQALTPEERTNFVIGRRSGVYAVLDDLNDARRYGIVEQIIGRLREKGEEIGAGTVFKLMEGFI